MTKRLTEKQKEEILRSFKSGTAINVLSQKYTCTNSTIIRNLKKILGELKFKELLKKSKSLQKKPKTNRNQNNQNQINNLQKTIKDNEISKKESIESKFEEFFLSSKTSGFFESLFKSSLAKFIFCLFKV